MMNIAIAGTSLASWIYLLFGRGGFWRARARDDRQPAQPATWPHVIAVVPARNEAECIENSVGSLLAQDYPGRLNIIVVDDESTDRTGEIARHLAIDRASERPLSVVASRALPAGWTGKLWALSQGIDVALADGPDYLLLTDADIVHAPDSVHWLAAHAEERGLVLASFMAKLRCESLAERAHVPAFIFFFQMLYPFSWVGHPGRGTAAAAGGCMLVRSGALREAGGIASIRSELIDDCALAKRLKARGPIWLGLTERVRSIRPYPTLADIRHMVSRSAYAQLRYSPLLLLGTIAAMTMTYLVPAWMTLLGSGWARVLGIGTWLLMAVAFQPTLRLYRMSPLWGFALPGIALLYMLYTIDSAYRYARGAGGMWKGRVQADKSRP